MSHLYLVLCVQWLDFGGWPPYLQEQCLKLCTWACWTGLNSKIEYSDRNEWRTWILTTRNEITYILEPRRICGLRNLSENIYKQCFLCLWHRHPKLKIVYVRHQDNKRRKLRYLTNEYQWTHTMNVFRSISCYCCCDAQPSSIIGVLVLWQRLQKTKLIIVIYWMLEYPETRICTI